MVKKSRISPIFKRAASYLFRKPVTEKYPFVKPHLPEDSRGRTVYEIKSCNIIELGGTSMPELSLDLKSIIGTSCRVCARDCPAGAIETVEVAGKKRPQIRLDKCIFCHQCVESCPRGAISSSDLYELASTSKGSLIMKPNQNNKEVKS